VVAFILDRRDRVGLAGADSKPIGPIIRLSPPAVENRKVQAAVQRGLLPGSAAGLLRTTRVVQPHVNSLNELARHVHVVVFDKYDPRREAMIPGEPHNILDQLLAHAVLGVGLAAEDELDRPVRRAHKRIQTLDVLQDQAGPLVGREPAREADRKRIQVESFHGMVDRLLRLIAAAGLRRQAIAQVVDQSRLGDLLRLPHFGILDRLDPPPGLGVALALVPFGAQVPFKELVHLGRDPTLGVHAVGDVSDRHVFFGRVPKERLPHPARDRAVQRTHAVGIPR
jgi:hypothetical protein